MRKKFLWQHALHTYIEEVLQIGTHSQKRGVLQTMRPIKLHEVLPDQMGTAQMSATAALHESGLIQKVSARGRLKIK